MTELPPLEHALFVSQAAGGGRSLAHSPGFREEGLAEAGQLCAGFGNRPAGVACPGAVFARPFARNHVAIVQAADQGQDDQGRPGALGFYVVVLPALLYNDLGGDPFALADRLPPLWSARGILSPLPCPDCPPQQRPVAEVVKLLQQPNSATLFGAAQALLDGGRLAFERSAPDEALVRGLWTLLPYSTRQELWPTTFAFDSALEFDVLVMPHLDPARVTGYILEEHAGDYPEGQYELALQTAADAGNQEEVNALFNRRSARQTQRLALLLLAIVFVLPLVAALLKNTGRDKKAAPETGRPEKLDAFRTLRESKFSALDQTEYSEVTVKLRDLAETLGTRVRVSAFGTVTALGLSAAPGAPLNTSALLSLGGNALASPEELLNALDVQLGTPDKDRRGRELWRLKSVELQLRALLYKHDVKGWNDRDQKPAELVELLKNKLHREGWRKKRRERQGR